MIGMAIISLDVTGQILAGDGTPAVGEVIFQIPVTLRDVADNIVYVAGSTFTATLAIDGTFTVTGLPATDSPDVSPLDWLYRVHVHTDIWAESFSTSLPAAFAPVAEFSDLIPAQSEPCTPDGTPCATLAQIADLQAQINEILLAGPVISVNGESGIVIIDAADVGADPAGSAAQALIDANAYTDAEILALDGGVVHLAGPETITGVKTFTANPVFNPAGIPQAAVANLVTDLASKVPTSLIDVKGDLLAGTANDAITRLAIGTDGQALLVNPVTATGFEYRAVDPDALNPGVTTFDRALMGSNTNVALGAASGNLRLVYFSAQRAEIWATVGWTGGTVAAGATPTLVRWGLYSVAVSGDLTLVASTVNNTALFAAPSAAASAAFSVAHAAVAGQRYALGVLVVSGAAIPSIQGASLNQQTVQASLPPRKTGLLAAQVDLPLNIVAGTVAASNCVFGAYITP